MRWLRNPVGPLMVVAAVAPAMAACGSSQDTGAGSGSGDDGTGSGGGARGNGAGGSGGGSGGSGDGSGSSSGGAGGGGALYDGGQGGSDTGSPLDGANNTAPAVVCTNTDNTIVTEDVTGVIYPQCNTWNIQGAWYCYADGIGTSDCVMGAVPYVEPDAGLAGGMCISGTTATGTNAYGAGLGLGLNSTLGASGVKSPIADASIIGFEITLTGGTHGSGGSVINVNMTTGATPGTYPAVTIPGVHANSTITYDVYIKDALEPFKANSPIAKPGGIYDLQFAIPAGAGVQYDYCVTKVKPITAPVALTGACSSTVAYGPAFCNQPQEYLEELDNFGVQNDTFANATGQMCIQAMRGGSSCAGFTATFNGFSSSIQYTPGAFPSLVYGWQAGNFYGGYAGGKTAGGVKTATTDWTFSVNNVSQYDAAYDIWFAPSQAPANAGGGLELMVWLQWSGVNPADYPAGSVATVTSGSKTFAAHKTTVSNNGQSWTYLAYLANSQTSSVSALDLKPFITDAMGRGLGSGWYLLGIQAGFEVYNASGSVTTSSFDVNLQ